MGTRRESIAAGNAIMPPADPYSPDNLMLYHVSLALIERLVRNGQLSLSDYRKSCRILTKKYGLPSDSIFAEIA